MEKYKVIEIKEKVYRNNDKKADKLRKQLKDNKTFLLNLMSSPGSGKTTTLKCVIDALKKDYKIGIIEADIDSDVDASTLSKHGVKVIQINTGGMCHLTAEMTQEAIDELDMTGLDLVILENIGNLICTADFDTGAVKNAMILSVCEGHDKPLKYPYMFEYVDLIIVNKIDVMPYFDFDMVKFKEIVSKLNKDVTIVEVSALKNEGFDELNEWLINETNKWRSE